MLGETPGSGQPNRHAPGLPTRSRNGAADTLFHQGRPTAGRSRFPSASGPVAPPAATMPRALPADSFAQAVAGRQLILRAVRRYARSCAAQPHLPVGLDNVRRRWEALPLTHEGS